MTPKNYTRFGRVLLDKALPRRYNTVRVQRQLVSGLFPGRNPAENAANPEDVLRCFRLDTEAAFRFL